MARLRLGAYALEVEPALLATAAPRVDASAFADASSEARSVLRLIQAPPGPAALPLGDEPGSYSIDGDTVLADAHPWTERAAEAALKALFAIAALRQGGLLVHASAVAFSGGAAVALGPSGAGKSTFARLLVEAGGVLLSDESVVLAPEGEVWATPFHSDFEVARERLRAPLRALVTLVKAPTEAQNALDEATLVQGILAQAYAPPPQELSRGALLERAASLAAAAERVKYAFRIHPEVGATWANRLA